MARLTREALIGASDLDEEDVELPTIGGSVRVRGLPAAYSNDAQSEATEVRNTPRGEQFVAMNIAKLEEIQVLHGLVDPKLNSIEDARTFATKCGPAWKTVVQKIDDLSGVDKEAIEKANARFRGSESGEERADVATGTPAGSSGSPVHS